MAKVELKSTVLALDAVTGLRTDSADSVAAGTMLGSPPPSRPDPAPPSPARRHAGVAPRQAPHHPAHPESRRRRLVEAVVHALPITHICGVQRWICAERPGLEPLSGTDTHRPGARWIVPAGMPLPGLTRNSRARRSRTNVWAGGCARGGVRREAQHPGALW